MLRHILKYLPFKRRSNRPRATPLTSSPNQDSCASFIAPSDRSLVHSATSNMSDKSAEVDKSKCSENQSNESASSADNPITKEKEESKKEESAGTNIKEGEGAPPKEGYHPVASSEKKYPTRQSVFQEEKSN